MAAMTNRNRQLLIAVTAAAILSAGAIAWNHRRGDDGRDPPQRPVVIAIAPFRVVGAGTEPWSGLGLAEEIKLALGRFPGIAVRNADSTSVSAPDYAITGTVSRGNGRSEIGVELTHGRDRAVLWTGTFWRTPADLSSFAAELADAVVQAVRLDEKRALLAREGRR